MGGRYSVTEGFLRLYPAFVYAKASFLMTFAMGGVPHAGSHVTQLCPTLCNLMDCSLPGYSVHGIFQAIVLEWIAISYTIMCIVAGVWIILSHKLVCQQRGLT